MVSTQPSHFPFSKLLMLVLLAVDESDSGKITFITSMKAYTHIDDKINMVCTYGIVKKQLRKRWYLVQH